nr:serine/threonine protein kinase [Nocardioidaceae bacterium]
MQPDSIADRYRVIRAVGRGGMGTVWLCRDEVLGRDVAVKQIGALPGESAENTARAMREARSAAALNHKNAVSIFDVVDHDGKPWLVMEYVPSRTLTEVLNEDGPLSPDRAARMGAQLAAALASAHGLGIIHRDVKPGNVLVGEGGLAKISDFGIARADYDDQLTQTGMMTGTPAYFSPELARGGDPSRAADVWALGATLFTAVEGRPPYESQSNPLAMLSKIASEPVPRPTRAGALAPIITGMLDPDPANRWTMSKSLGALRGVADRGRAGTAVAADDDQTAVTERVPPYGEQGAGRDRTTPVPIPAAATPPSDPAAAGRYEEDTRRGWPFPTVLAAALGLLLLLGLGGLVLYNTAGDDPSSTAQNGGGSPSPQTTGPVTTGPATTEPTATEQQTTDQQTTEQQTTEQQATEQQATEQQTTEQQTSPVETTAATSEQPTTSEVPITSDPPATQPAGSAQAAEDF